jgi:hypothetical protein
MLKDRFCVKSTSFEKMKDCIQREIADISMPALCCVLGIFLEGAGPAYQAYVSRLRLFC